MAAEEGLTGILGLQPGALDRRLQMAVLPLQRGLQAGGPLQVGPLGPPYPAALHHAIVMLCTVLSPGVETSLRAMTGQAVQPTPATMSLRTHRLSVGCKLHHVAANTHHAALPLHAAARPRLLDEPMWEGHSLSDLMAMDQEGRLVITDHGGFFSICVHAPCCSGWCQASVPGRLFMLMGGVGHSW